MSNQVSEGSPPPLKIKGRMEIEYTWSLGRLGTRFFEAIRTERRLLGIRCPSCRGVLVPPLPTCGRCFAPMSEWVDLPDTGMATSIVPYLLEYPGQALKPPIIFAKIRLDGADSSFTHILGDIPPGPLPQTLRVRARWRAERIGSIEDIVCFVPGSTC
ncbi:MAG: DNA-binding protein [Nitrospirae bacterium]|nr:DNA-binding protein [Nitrospirota bacterium]